MQCHIYKILIIRFHIQYAIITIANSPSQQLAASISRKCTESEEIKQQPGRTRLSHYTDCHGINNHPHPEKLMLQKLCFIGISERRADIVFQRAYAAAAMHVMCPLCTVHVGAGGPAFTQQRGTDALWTTAPPWHTQLLACDGGLGRRRKASRTSDHSGREITKPGSVFPVCSSVPLSQIALAINAWLMQGNNIMLIVKLLHLAAFK